MTLAADFEAFIELLNKYQVRYLVVGGYALAFHGMPRFTGDLDIWIEVSVANAGGMMNVVKDFGIGSLGLVKGDFLKEGYITQIGYPPLRIDLLHSIDGVDFSAAYRNKETITIDDLTITYIALNDLLKNKKAYGRPRDLSDIKEIEKTKAKKSKRKR